MGRDKTEWNRGSYEVAYERQALQRQAVMTILLIPFLVIKAASGGFDRRKVQSPMKHESWSCSSELLPLVPCGVWAKELFHQIDTVLLQF